MFKRTISVIFLVILATAMPRMGFASEMNSEPTLKQEVDKSTLQVCRDFKEIDPVLANHIAQGIAKVELLLLMKSVTLEGDVNLSVAQIMLEQGLINNDEFILAPEAIRRFRAARKSGCPGIKIDWSGRTDDL